MSGLLSALPSGATLRRDQGEGIEALDSTTDSAPRSSFRIALWARLCENVICDQDSRKCATGEVKASLAAFFMAIL